MTLSTSERQLSAAGQHDKEKKSFLILNAQIIVLILFSLIGCGGGGGSQNSPSPTNTFKPTPTSAVQAPTPPSSGPLRPVANGITRIACLGDSITAGVKILDPRVDSYPAVLGRLLGGKYYEVRNFGISGAAVSRRSPKFYQVLEAYRKALIFKPDVIVIALGTNDAAFSYAARDQQNFTEDYDTLIEAFKQTDPAVQVYLCLPPPIYSAQGEKKETLREEIIPLIARIADKNNYPLIDLYTLLNNRPELFPDGIHPNERGDKLIANEIHRVFEG